MTHTEYMRIWRAANPEADRKYQHRRKDAKLETTRKWTAAHPEKIREYRKRRNNKHPEKRAARAAVYRATTSFRFPPANTLVCEVCGEALAAHWHHHLGYEREHWLDVIAVCKECHGAAHRQGAI